MIFHNVKFSSVPLKSNSEFPSLKQSLLSWQFPRKGNGSRILPQTELSELSFYHSCQFTVVATKTLTVQATWLFQIQQFCQSHRNKLCQLQEPQCMECGLPCVPHRRSCHQGTSTVQGGGLHHSWTQQCLVGESFSFLPGTSRMIPSGCLGTPKKQKEQLSSAFQQLPLPNHKKSLKFMSWLALA